MSVATPSLSSAPVSVPPSLSHSAPIPSTVLPQPISYQVPPPTMDYGVDDVLGETRVSDPHSISGYSQPDPTTEAILQEMEEDDPLELQDEAFLGGSATQGETGMEEQMSQEEGAQEQTEEITFTLPFRQGGFFRTWLMSFFVVDRYSIRMYQNEKRNERKMKEILLVDAVVQVGDMKVLCCRKRRSIPMPNIRIACRSSLVPAPNTRNRSLLRCRPPKKRANSSRQFRSTSTSPSPLNLMFVLKQCNRTARTAPSPSSRSPPRPTTERAPHPQAARPADASPPVRWNCCCEANTIAMAASWRTNRR